jgi:hypothetical protein
VATVHDAVKETIRAHLTLVHLFHMYASMDTLWVAHALSRCTPIRYGRIASVSATHDATQFVRPQEIPYVLVHNSKLVHSDPIDMGLNRHRQGYRLGPLNLRSDHSSSFPSSVLHFSLIAPPGL